jgi:hypothetical protein
MRILNLYAGIGGNRALWGDEHEVTAIENVDYIADDLTRQRKSTEILTNAYGITLPLTTKNQRKLLRNAVDPIVGLHVFNQVALQKTDKNLVKQEILF